MINTPKNINVFIAYVEEDRSFLEELEEHLSVLERLGMVDKIWYNGMVEAGSNWEETTLNALRNADIILLLISSNFIASDFAYHQEMQQAIELHQAGKVKTIPIIVRPCLWDRTPFSKLQILPKSKIPVSSNSWEHVDEPYVQIVTEVEQIIANLKRKEIGGNEQRQYSEFNQSVEEAGHYFASRKWPEAQAKYQRALLFSDRQSLNVITDIEERIAFCRKEIYLRRAISRGEKAHQEDRFSDTTISPSKSPGYEVDPESGLKRFKDKATKGLEEKSETSKPKRAKFLQIKILGIEIFKLVVSLCLIGVIGITALQMFSRPNHYVAIAEPGGVIYVNESNEEILKTSYPAGKDFSQGIAAVKNENEKWGYINLEKETKIEFDFDNAWPHSPEGLAYVKKDGKCGFIDVSGKVKIPLVYLDAASFSEGLAMVKKGEKDFAFIDKNGKEVIGGLEGVLTPKFKEGEVIVIRKGQQMTIDKKGNCLEACLTSKEKELSENQKNKTIKEYEKKTEILVESEEYERALMKAKEIRKLSTNDAVKNQVENKIDLIERKINKSKEAAYKKLIKEAEPLFRKGDFIKAKPIYEEALQLGLLFSKEAETRKVLCEQYIYIEANKTGKVYGFRHPNGRWGIKTQQREVLLAPQYDSVGVFANGFIPVQEEGLWGFADINGELKIKPFYESVAPFSEAGLVKVIKNGKKGFIDRNGRPAEPREGQ